MRKLKIFIAMSLDGFIAKPNDDLSFLKAVEKEGEDYGYGAFTSGIDTLIIGRKTYDYVVNQIGREYYDNGSNEVYIITRTPQAATGKTTFYTGDIKALVHRLRALEGKDIYCDGGAQVIHELLSHDLVDELIISMIPILLGEGTRLFNEGRPEQLLELIDVKSYDTGLVQVHYKRKHDDL